jgi:hypothetical protein
MLALSLLFHLFLSGSLLVPIMVLVRWGGARWGGLRWLTRSRKRWILIWGGLGLVRVVARAVLGWADFPNAGIEPLGWSGGAVWSVLYALHIRTEPLSIAYWVVGSLGAIAEGVIHCGFAATAWWAFQWTTRNALEHRRRVPTEGYCVALLLSACLWGIANNVHSWRPVTCCDCFWPHGIPFTFYHEGGFAGGEGYVWRGVIGDALVVILFGAILGWAGKWFSREHSIVTRR